VLGENSKDSEVSTLSFFSLKLKQWCLCCWGYQWWKYFYDHV